MKQDVTTALESYKKTCNSLDINFIVIDGLTKKLCKQNSVSPDAIMQLSFQVIIIKCLILLHSVIVFFCSPPITNNMASLWEAMNPAAQQLSNMVEQRQLDLVLWKQR